ncbi:hypothetical protein [Virgibacillus necropolis]|uniref:hypothetical protein n=1 Tax=Virgibacillus necropolis TaxID=163877 RepID=UPI0013747B3D|nr:hypothetical protein [Virgibacillus necropolis]
MSDCNKKPTYDQQRKEKLKDKKKRELFGFNALELAAITAILKTLYEVLSSLFLK